MTHALDRSSDQRTLVIVLSAMVAVVVSSATAAAIDQAAIAEAFGAGPADVAWVVFGYSAMFAVATVLYASVAARVGVGRSMAIGTLVFGAGAAAAAIAPTLPLVILARMAQGLGSGAIPTLSIALIAARLDGPARIQAIGATVAGVGVGYVLGPVLGGLLLEAVGWRGPLAMGIVIAPAAWLVLRADPAPGDPGARVDLRGIVLLGTVAVGWIVTLNRLPLLGVAPLTVGAMTVAILAGWSAVARGRSDPGAIPPRRMTGDRQFRRLLWTGAIGQSTYLGAVVAVPIALARAQDVGGMGFAAVLLPMAIIVAVASPRAGRFGVRYGRRRTSMSALAGLALAAVGMAISGPDGPIPVVAGLLGLVGLCIAVLQPPIVDEVTEVFGGVDRSLAIGLFYLAYFVGGATGGAVASALIQAGLELPVFAGSAVPGFSTAMIALGVLPAIGAVGLASAPAGPAPPGHGSSFTGGTAVPDTDDPTP